MHNVEHSCKARFPLPVSHLHSVPQKLGVSFFSKRGGTTASRVSSRREVSPNYLHSWQEACLCRSRSESWHIISHIARYPFGHFIKRLNQNDSTKSFCYVKRLFQTKVSVILLMSQIRSPGKYFIFCILSPPSWDRGGISGEWRSTQSIKYKYIMYKELKNISKDWLSSVLLWGINIYWFIYWLLIL